MSEPPLLSVVIPTHDRRERLDRVLSSLARQTVDVPFEVIVVSDGSTDGTDEYLRSGTTPVPVTAIEQPNQGPAAARNAGVRQASADLVVFLDDDVVAEPELLAAHLDSHRRHGGDAVVIGPMLDPPDHQMSPWVRWEQAMLAKQYAAMEAGVFAASPRQFFTGNASVRRTHLDTAGGFDTSFRRAEDIELAYRLKDLGLQFHFEPCAVGRHYAERSFTSWRSVADDYGRNDVIFARRLARDSIYRFIRRGFHEHHAAIRWLVRRAVRSERWRVGSTRWLGAMGRPAIASRAWWVSRSALSAIRAVDYHCGVAAELGSAAAFDELMASSATAIPRERR